MLKVISVTSGIIRRNKVWLEALLKSMRNAVMERRNAVFIVSSVFSELSSALVYKMEEWLCWQFCVKEADGRRSEGGGGSGVIIESLSVLIKKGERVTLLRGWY